MRAELKNLGDELTGQTRHQPRGGVKRLLVGRGLLLVELGLSRCWMVPFPNRKGNGQPSGSGSKPHGPAASHPPECGRGAGLVSAGRWVGIAALF
ncbi:hypothetical protein ABIA32_006334 [Streptacidiphilus sp. MAP12-20]